MTVDMYEPLMMEKRNRATSFDDDILNPIINNKSRQGKYNNTLNYSTRPAKNYLKFTFRDVGKALRWNERI